MSKESVPKDQTVCRVATVIVLFVVLAVFNFDVVVDSPRKFRDFHEEWVRANVPISSTEEETFQPVYPKSEYPSFFERSKASGQREILGKLRELTRLAADGQDYTLTAAQRTAWHEHNPCQSRSELPAMYAARKHVKDLPSNADWEQVLDEYSNLHRICMGRVGNLTEHFLNTPNATVPGCKFIIGEGTNGLGNKLLVTVSAVLYAIATQRILLMPPRTNLKTVLCEPFMGSSWMLETDHFTPGGTGQWSTSWVEDNVFIQNMYSRIQLLKTEKAVVNQTQTPSTPRQKLPPLVDALIVSSGWGQWQPHEWFYCSTEQNFMAEVPWVYLSGCLYSAPKIFGSPPFSAALRAVFPDNMVLTRLFRSVLLPGDLVWSRFKHLDHAYFQQPDRRVAVQLRFYGDTYQTMSSLVNERVLDCVLRNGILPDVVSPNLKLEGSPSPSPITKVFIASLYPDLHNRLSEFYLRNPTESGEDVSVVQVTNRLYQSVGVEEDTEALVEVLLLSVSDALLVTPGSTFGGLAHGYGGLTPWFINTVNFTSTDSCERGVTVDDCQLDARETYNCPNDPAPDPPDWSKDAGEGLEQPILGPCLIFGYRAGSQVITRV